MMGFASGLPLALTGTTLTQRLTEAKLPLTVIGSFALVQIAYNLKFLWAPAVDRVSIPILTRLVGRRRSWLLLLEVLLIASILALGRADPARLGALAVCAVVVAFFSASQDIVIDAYRIELLVPAEQGAGAAATQLGYRLGMIVSGAGALYAATAFGWFASYGLMAVLVLIGGASLLFTPEPVVPGAASREDASAALRRSMAALLDAGHCRRYLVIGAFIISYMLGTAVAGHMAIPLYGALGFDRNEIATVNKLLGTIATMVGISGGGYLVYRLGTYRVLAIGSVAQMMSNALYIVQVHAGHDLTVLGVTVFAENFAVGIASAGFVAYLSSLCDPAYTATQYALLSALMALGRNVFASQSGALASSLGWIPFYSLTVLLTAPGLLLLLWIMRDARRGRAIAAAAGH